MPQVIESSRHLLHRNKTTNFLHETNTKGKNAHRVRAKIRTKLSAF